MRNTLEESSRLKRQHDSLVSVRPGTYMLLRSNKMKRVMTEAQGLLVGDRVENDNHKIVLVDEELILVPDEDSQ